MRVSIIGMGYVGLPLALAAARAGLEVHGLDINAATVQALNEGRSHVDDLSDENIQEMLERGFTATTEFADVAKSDVVVVCVPTPLSGEGGPDLTAVTSAMESIARHLQRDQLVVLESTTWPGTTEEVVQPILEASGLTAGRDFFLAFSPERVDPGNPTYGVTNTPKVVGGLTPACTERANDFYGRFVEKVVRARGCREAEMAKLLENTYRHINIALVNEMLKFSDQLGIDFWDVIRCAATKPFGFQSFTPGPGVGGPCIPIDPNYLSHRVRTRLGYPFRFVELAQEVNQSMPAYVATKAAEILNDAAKPVRGSAILLLGVTYKAGIADQRESPAIPLGEALLRRGAELEYHDPFVPVWRLDGGELDRTTDLEQALAKADLVILLQPHEQYSADLFATAPDTPVLDTRGVLEGDHVRRL